MRDLQLRWVREDPLNPDSKLKLQCRKLIADDSIIMWTEWKDVPIVEDPSKPEPVEGQDGDYYEGI